MQPLISLSGISKKFGAHFALSDVDLDIGTGVTGLLGPNGAGKSTLIKLLLGLVRSTSGTGSVLGQPLGRKNGRWIRSRIGYVPEDDCYIPGLTGVEVVRFSATLSGMDPVEGLRRAHEILDFCNMKEDRYRAVEGYSTGMRQKVKFAAALVHDPDLLILDEPTSGLDPEERDSLLSRIRILAKRHGKSVLLSTHILPDVQSVCDHVVILANGRMRLNQSLEAINRPVADVISVQLDSGIEAFVAALQKRGYAASADNGTTVGIRGGDAKLHESIWKIASETGAVVHSISPAKNSLESVFLKSIEEQADART